MIALLYTFGGWLAGSLVARLLVGAGLGFGTYQILEPLINNYVNAFIGQLGGLAGELSSILWIAGAGEAMSPLLAALLPRVAIQATMTFVGKAASQ